MADIRHIHRYMTDRRRVLLDDGRQGEIVRIDTVYPESNTTVSIYTGPRSGLAKVSIEAVVGPAPEAQPA